MPSIMPPLGARNQPPFGPRAFPVRAAHL
jgi:hypothetical protein